MVRRLEVFQLPSLVLVDVMCIRMSGAFISALVDLAWYFFNSL